MSENQLRRARVIAVGRNAAWVVPDGEAVAIVASMRKTQLREMPAPGDLAWVHEIETDRVVIDRLEPRSFALIRHTGGGRTKTMAANVDTLGIVVALVDPPPSLLMIDSLIAFAEQHGVASALLLTKADLAGEAAAAAISTIYEGIGVSSLVLQPNDGHGIAALRDFIVGRSILLVGNSGVGKSSIFRALGGTATVGDLTRFGRGRQTTTSARLFQTADGFLIDSPGIGEFTLDPLPPADLARLFLEIRRAADGCRFRDCRHLSEPGCAVRAALEAGTIAPSRYASYRELCLLAPAR